MKYSKYYVTVILLFAFLVAPAMAMAQTASSSQLFQEGSSESRGERRERIRGYRRQASDVEQKITALGSTAVYPMFMPVLFGVEVRNISPNFGDPRSGGRTHEGEDIMAVKGTPIISPTNAVVIRTGVGPSEGNYVYTANPGGETFVYMHLDRIGEGVVSGLVLTQGSLIGYVGNTGNAIGGAAHLHFEIHNSSDVPMAPFPRLTIDLSLQEKISYLSTILTQTTDSVVLSEFLVKTFRSTFNSAVASNIVLPAPIANALATASAVSAPVNGGVTLPAGDLSLGSSGTAVVVLQRYLIQSASGASAVRLAGAGATGYFGVLTKAALLEYQIASGISSPDGYYGPATRTFITGHPLGGTAPSPTPISTPVAVGTTPLVLPRNLYLGITGEDVRTLQRLLNAKGFMVAITGAGSPGNETIYFGPATRAAVIKFQVARGISPAAGYAGPVTRNALSALTL